MPTDEQLNQHLVEAPKGFKKGDLISYNWGQKKGLLGTIKEVTYYPDPKDGVNRLVVRPTDTPGETVEVMPHGVKVISRPDSILEATDEELDARIQRIRNLKFNVKPPSKRKRGDASNVRERKKVSTIGDNLKKAARSGAIGDDALAILKETLKEFQE